MQLVRLALPITLLEDVVKVVYYHVDVIHISMLTLIEVSFCRQLTVEQLISVESGPTKG